MSFQYSINDGPKQDITPVTGQESHVDFYEYGNGKATHSYQQYRTTTLLIYQSTSTGTYSLVITHHNADNQWDGGIGVRTIFSQSLNSFSGYIVRDDPDTDSYGPGEMDQGFSGAKTDGAVIDVAQWDEVTISLDHTVVTDPENRTIQEFGIYSDPNTFDTAGRMGQITIYVPEGLTPVNSTEQFPSEGDDVMLLREDLAHL